jgi:hypothetical protein
VYIIVLEDAKLKSFHSVEKDTFCTSIQELPNPDIGGAFCEFLREEEELGVSNYGHVAALPFRCAISMKCLLLNSVSHVALKWVSKEGRHSKQWRFIRGRLLLLWAFFVFVLIARAPLYWNLVEFLNWDVGLKVLGFWVSQGEEEVLSSHFGSIIYQFFLF